MACLQKKRTPKQFLSSLPLPNRQNPSGTRCPGGSTRTGVPEMSDKNKEPTDGELLEAARKSRKSAQETLREAYEEHAKYMREKYFSKPGKASYTIKCGYLDRSGN